VQVGIVQVQPAPASAVIVRPVGGVSVTVTGPLDAEAPTFLTVTVYVMVCPGTAVLGLCTFAIVRSLPDTGAVMVVGSDAVLLPVFVSPPPDTMTMFVSLPGATTGSTLAFTVIPG
jgi:hypothetical protein